MKKNNTNPTEIAKVLSDNMTSEHTLISTLFFLLCLTGCYGLYLFFKDRSDKRLNETNRSVIDKTLEHSLSAVKSVVGDALQTIPETISLIKNDIPAIQNIEDNMHKLHGHKTKLYQQNSHVSVSDLNISQEASRELLKSDPRTSPRPETIEGNFQVISTNWKETDLFAEFYIDTIKQDDGKTIKIRANLSWFNEDDKEIIMRAICRDGNHHIFKARVHATVDIDGNIKSADLESVYKYEAEDDQS